MPASRAQRAATAERRQKMMQLRLAGADWATIAQACGYSGPAAACKDFSRALELSLKEVNRNAELIRHELLLKLQRLQRGVWPAAVAGDPQAAGVALNILKEEIRLQGVNNLPPPEDGATFDRRESIRSQGAALAQIVGLFLTKIGMDFRDPRYQQALRESVQEVTGIPLPPARGVIEGTTVQ